jgi:hypothetical protein
MQAVGSLGNNLDWPVNPRGLPEHFYDFERSYLKHSVDFLRALLLKFLSFDILSFYMWMIQWALQWDIYSSLLDFYRLQVPDLLILTSSIFGTQWCYLLLLSTVSTTSTSLVLPCTCTACSGPSCSVISTLLLMTVPFNWKILLPQQRENIRNRVNTLYFRTSFVNNNDTAFTLITSNRLIVASPAGLLFVVATVCG